MEELQRIHDIMTIIETKCDEISCRVMVDGRWKNLFLSELPGNIAIREAFKLIRRGTIPHFITPPDLDM